MIKQIFYKLKPILIGVLVIALIVLVAVIISKFGGKEKCVYITPLALQNFEAAGGERPVEAEKCEISRNSYLIKITYEDKGAASRAKMLLTAGTEGEKGEIDGSEWITNEGDSSVFFQKGKVLGIFIMSDETKESKVEKGLEKAKKYLE